METYNNFISQFEIINKKPRKTPNGFHYHHIVPISEQTEFDDRGIMITPTQHLWAHILYDREHNTNTSSWLTNLCGKTMSFFDCWEKCLAYSYTLSKKQFKCHTQEAKKHFSQVHKGRPSGFKGHHPTEEARAIMSAKKKESYVGEGNPFYNKKHSEESIRKMSESHKGNTAVKGMKWFNDGTTMKRAYECPEGFKPGYLRKVTNSV